MGAIGIKYVSSLLFVSDVNLSRNFYENILCQKVALDHGECVTFSAGFAIMLKDYAHGIIFKGQPSGPSSGQNTGVELYFETDDIVGVRDSLRERNVRFIHDIVEQPWGQRVFRVYDPDMYIVEFGEPMEIVIKRFIKQGLSAEETAARTSMPLDIVRQVAKRVC
jgi:uncharacterized glyoxalase superfamily protein PhnB